MGQSHSKRYKSRRYQFGEGLQPDGPKQQRRYHRRQKQQRTQHQQLAQHSQHVHQQQQLRQDDQLFRRRSSQDYLSALAQAQARSGVQAPKVTQRPVSWHDMRVNIQTPALHDVRPKSTGRYRLDDAPSPRRERASYYATEDTGVTTMGYFSMETRDTYPSQRDTAFAPDPPRVQRSEVTDVEIEQLVADLRESEWRRLGSSLGVSKSGMEDIHGRSHGDLVLAAKGALLLWKKNNAHVDNPRSQLSLALSTIGREDLYGKIKRREYLHIRAPSERRRVREPPVDHRPESVGAESGVDTTESLSDSLEEESDEEDQHKTILQKQISREEDKPTVIPIPGVTQAERNTRRPQPQTKQSAETVDEQLPEEPATPTNPAETVSTAVIRNTEAPDKPSTKGSIVQSNVHQSAARKVVLDKDLQQPRRQQRPVEASSQHHRKKPDLVDAKPQNIQKPVTKASKPKLSQEVTEGELHVLAGEVRSEKEWRKLGQRLGISNAEMKGLSDDHAEDVTQCASRVFKLWKKRHNNASRERYILANVLSDIGRDDLYALIRTRKLLEKIEILETSLQRWRQELKDAYINPTFDPTQNSRLIEVDLVYQDNVGNETKLLNRHGILKCDPERDCHSVFVVHGDAGCGKTTLLNQLARDWAEDNRDSDLARVPLVLCLSLKELRVCGSIGQGVVSFLLLNDTKMTADLVDDYLKLYPERVVLLLDGADISQMEGDLFLLRQMRSQTSCRMIVSSRKFPEECEEPTFPCISIQVQDLNANQRNTFIQSYFELDVSKRKSLVEYLRHDDILTSLSARPMFLRIICSLWEHDVAIHDLSTLSDLLMTYGCFLRGDQGANHRLSDDIAARKNDIHKALSELGKVALPGVMHSSRKMFFKAGDLANCQESAEMASTMGLLVSSPQVVKLNGKTSHSSTDSQIWHFVDPLLHEKCAGIALAELHKSNPDDFERTISKVKFMSQAETLQFVLMFACNESVDVAKRIVKLLGDISWRESNPGAMLACQELALKCNFECHRGESLNKELQFNLRSLQVAAFKGNILADVTLRYFIKASVTDASSPLQLERVQFKITSKIDMDYAIACLQSGYFLTVPEMNFEMPKSFSPSRESSRRLAQDVMSPNIRCLKVSCILSSSDFISRLQSADTLVELVGTDIDPKYINVSTWCRQYPNLHVLRLRCAMYHSPNQLKDYRKALNDLEIVLCGLTHLSTLSLSNFYSSERMVQILTKLLSTLPKLSEVQIGPSGDDLEHYADEIEHECGEISEPTMQAFTKAAKKASKLKTMRLSCFGNFEKLYRLIRVEARTGGRRPSGLQYSPDASEDGYWVFKRM